MEQKTKILVLVILAALVGTIGTMSAVAAQDQEHGKIIINGEDVTSQFVDDPTVLKGTYSADSTNIRLAEIFAEFYLPYLESGLDVYMYYGPYTLRISITIPATTDVS